MKLPDMFLLMGKNLPQVFRADVTAVQKDQIEKWKRGIVPVDENNFKAFLAGNSVFAYQPANLEKLEYEPDQENDHTRKVDNQNHLKEV